MYISQYDQTSAHIERLTGMLSEIRDNIQQLIGQPQRQRETSTPINNRRFRSRESYNVLYDYSRPIDHSIYLDIPLTTQSTNRYTTNANRNLSQASNTIVSDLLNTFLNSTVPIRPTQQQLTNASRTVRYSDIQGPLSESCPITLERFEPDQLVTQLIPCEHIFETNGFNNWFQNNVRCPVCRYDIREYRQTNNTRIINIPNTSNTSDISNTSNTSNISNISNTSSPNTSNTSNTSNTTNISNTSRPNTSRHNTSNISNTSNTSNASNNISTNQLLNELISGFANSTSTDHLYFRPNYSYVLYETVLPSQTQTQTQTQAFTNQENTTNNNA